VTYDDVTDRTRPFDDDCWERRRCRPARTRARVVVEVAGTEPHDARQAARIALMRE
jgi:hypothetical protein